MYYCNQYRDDWSRLTSKRSFLMVVVAVVALLSMCGVDAQKGQKKNSPGKKQMKISKASAQQTGGGGKGRKQVPCHIKKWDQGSKVTCEGVLVPRRLCVQCGLKAVKKNGNFVNCKSMHNVDTEKCRAELRKYWKANPRDWKRKQQTERWNAGDKEGLDYFVYSICEQCCDCIPKGSKIGILNRLKSQGKLYTHKRGNCPAQARYDVCKVLPHVRYISPIGGSNHTGWPKICPLLTQWKTSGRSENWLQNRNAAMSPAIVTFLYKMNQANSCSSVPVWNKCVGMETKQKRIFR